MLKYLHTKFLLASAFALAACPAQAYPVPVPIPVQLPTPIVMIGGLFRAASSPIRDGRLNLYRLDNLTLDYANATSYSNSNEVWGAKVSVTVKDVSFLAALDALMNASTKTCRIEVRQMCPQRVSLNVKDVPLVGMLDSLAKVGGAHLYVLPGKIILAPGTALTEDEKKRADLYGVLLTAATLPNTPEAKALLKPDAKGKTILDVANSEVHVEGKDIPLSTLLGGWLNGKTSQDEFAPKIVGPVSQADLDSVLSFRFQGVKYGDALASFARSIGCELYLTPEHFLICAPEHLNDPEALALTQGAVPAFTAASTTSRFFDPSWSRF